MDTTGDLFDPEEGQRRAEEGMEQVGAHNEDWAAQMGLEVVSWIRLQEELFAGEDFRRHCVLAKLPKPKHPNAWGSLWRGFVGETYVEFTGQYRSAKSKHSHRHPVKLYRPGAFFKNVLQLKAG
jgi:hypothetical protein